MSLGLRAAWPNRHDDFQVFDGEDAVGRLRFIAHPESPKWRWSIYESAIRGGAGKVVFFPNGTTDSRDQAMAALEAAWKAERGW
jgi:hypothetical protein